LASATCVNRAGMEVDELSHDVEKLGVAKWSGSWMLNENRVFYMDHI
jgi:hypothetical protein